MRKFAALFVGVLLASPGSAMAGLSLDAWVGSYSCNVGDGVVRIVTVDYEGKLPVIKVAFDQGAYVEGVPTVRRRADGSVWAKVDNQTLKFMDNSVGIENGPLKVAPCARN